MPRRSKYSYFFVFSFSLAALLMSGCGERKLYVPGNMSDERITVEEKDFYYEYDISAFDEQKAEAIAAHYHSVGDGPVTLTLYYDPLSKKNTALEANQRLMTLNKLLRNAGLDQLKPSILPVKDLGDGAVLSVEYGYYVAHKPNCEPMPGYHSRKLDVQRDYKMGCTIDTLISQQVVDPRDLSGYEAPAGRSSEGRSAANVVEPVRAGVRNEPLGGFEASGGE